MLTPGTTVTFAPEPYAPPDDNAGRVHIGPLARHHVMVQRRDHGIVTDEGSITDVDASLVLESTATVDEHILAKTNVLAKVSTERREELEGFRDPAPG